jgi:hypothetical protein
MKERNLWVHDLLEEAVRIPEGFQPGQLKLRIEMSDAHTENFYWLSFWMEKKILTIPHGTFHLPIQNAPMSPFEGKGGWT